MFSNCKFYKIQSFTHNLEKGIRNVIYSKNATTCCLSEISLGLSYKTFSCELARMSYAPLEFLFFYTVITNALHPYMLQVLT